MILANPPPKVTWYKLTTLPPKMPTPPPEPEKKPEDEEEAEEEAEPQEEEDDGVYWGEEPTQEVVAEPEEPEEPKEPFVPGPPIIVPVLVGYIPDPNIVIFTHPDEVGKHTMASLTYHKPSYMECGHYICVAENEHGTARQEHDCSFITEDEFYQMKAAIYTERQKIHDIKPSKIELPKKKGAAVDLRVPEPYKPIILSEEELQIKMSDVYYRKIYEAKMRKQAEEKKTRKEPEPELFINTDAEFITKPFCVVAHLLNHTVLEGKDLKLSWVVKAFDELEATWTKNGKLVAFGRRVLSQVTLDGLISLEIHEARLSDSGIYRCTVKSKKYGSLTQECQVTVFKVGSSEVAPSFTRLMRGILICL